jgi:hypothetical protein
VTLHGGPVVSRWLIEVLFWGSWWLAPDGVDRQSMVISHVVPDLIDDLLDDDVFPDPDYERIAYLVFMPKGSTETIGANGAHTLDDDYEFPFDKDYYWVGSVRWFDDIPGIESREDVPRTATHEFVELCCDPEGDGWIANTANTGEIGDPAVLLPEINLKSNRLYPHDFACGLINSSHGRLHRAAGEPHQLRRTAAHTPCSAPLLQRRPGL